MIKTLKFVFLFALAATSVGCQKKEASSRLTISFPRSSSSSNVHSGVSAFAAVDRTLLCYVVNVRGDGIDEKSTSCQFPRGVVAGSIAEGNTLALEVTAGTRSIEILGLLRENSSVACPAITATEGTWAATKTYMLFKKSVTLVPGENVIDAQLTLPDAANHIVQTGELPAVCTATPTPSPTPVPTPASATGVSYLQQVSHSSLKVVSTSGYEVTLKVKPIGNVQQTSGGYKFFPKGSGQ